MLLSCKAFPVQVPGVESRRTDFMMLDWEHGRDIYIDVVGTFPLARSHRAGFVPGEGGGLWLRLRLT